MQTRWVFTQAVTYVRTTDANRPEEIDQLSAIKNLCLYVYCMAKFSIKIFNHMLWLWLALE